MQTNTADRTAASGVLLADIVLQHEVEQFLYHEAALLDERRFHEWLKLLADDLEYWMPVRSTRARGDEQNEFAAAGEGAFFDETKKLMEIRVRKLDTGYSWAEDPPSRTRHVVSNVRVLEKISDTEVRVGCNFILYRSRLVRDEDWWVGRREDTLRNVNGNWMLARRHIFLDQVGLLSRNLSVFF
jgi:3-phenylpropionate/cinnamic acid dioxygenase small subunit